MKRMLTIVLVYVAMNFGAAFLFRRRRRSYAGIRRHFLVTQGGADLRPTSREIEDAVVSVLMGGIVLDLRETGLVRRPARIEVLAVMGGVEILVPEDWNVRLDIEPTMGGVQDRRTGPVDPERPDDLVVSGRLVMGGLDIGHRPPGRRRGEGKVERGLPTRSGRPEAAV